MKDNPPAKTIGNTQNHVLKGFNAAGSIATGGKLFAEINLPFTMKQYRNDNIANFVYLWKN